jgi:hypothetical protein
MCQKPNHGGPQRIGIGVWHRRILRSATCAPVVARDLRRARGKDQLATAGVTSEPRALPLLRRRLDDAHEVAAPPAVASGAMLVHDASVPSKRINAT